MSTKQARLGSSDNLPTCEGEACDSPALYRVVCTAGEPKGEVRVLCEPCSERGDIYVGMWGAIYPCERRPLTADDLPNGGGGSA